MARESALTLALLGGWWAVLYFLTGQRWVVPYMWIVLLPGTALCFVVVAPHPTFLPVAAMCINGVLSINTYLAGRCLGRVE